MPFAPRIAFVDVETTGTSPATARITEVGVVLVAPGRDGAGSDGEPCAEHRVERWSTLVNPGTPIPPEIRFLTGITDAMVANAPRFAEIADELRARLDGAVFVAHQARFDYGFLRREFERAGIAFHATTLCTVRLSRLLFPDRSPHSLDAIIARLGLPVADRHRALGDAQVLWEFVQALYRRFPRLAVDDAVRKLLRHPGLPSHLPADALERLPRHAGVYAFYGLNDHPLYVGSSLNVRERVAQHFCGDHASERGLRLASETRRVECVPTAGGFGARLLEAHWIRTRMPAHNVAQRRRSGAVFVALDMGSAQVRYRPAEGVDPAELDGLHGPFASRATARAALCQAARSHALCEKAMGLETGRPDAACFRRQLGRCAGACVGEEPPHELARRAAAALAALRVPAWPYDSPIAIVEEDSESGHEDWQVFDRWCHLGTAHGESAAAELAAREPRFEPSTFRLLRAVLHAAAECVTPAGAPASAPVARATRRREPAPGAMRIVRLAESPFVAADAGAPAGGR